MKKDSILWLQLPSGCWIQNKLQLIVLSIIYLKMKWEFPFLCICLLDPYPSLELTDKCPIWLWTILNRNIFFSSTLYAFVCFFPFSLFYLAKAGIISWRSSWSIFKPKGLGPLSFFLNLSNNPTCPHCMEITFNIICKYCNHQPIKFCNFY